MYNNACHKLIRQTVAAIARYNICELALRPDDHQAGFKRSGIYPFNRDTIPKESFTPAELHVDSESDATIEGGICTLAEGYDLLDCKKKELKTKKYVKKKEIKQKKH
ncbi:hypothetical protein DPMN_058818 [Dreissena polymorpha]|uniref:Uncharacterized protein n=1 Tax=Dreissena polymorpha TaxID=45954 RepID=A0A9D4C2S3_DREPO|nr:hypothetical protein DPMN_058818 [Dreissena polymorpha]